MGKRIRLLQTGMQLSLCTQQCADSDQICGCGRLDRQMPQVFGSSSSGTLSRAGKLSVHACALPAGSSGRPQRPPRTGHGMEQASKPAHMYTESSPNSQHRKPVKQGPRQRPPPLTAPRMNAPKPQLQRAAESQSAPDDEDEDQEFEDEVRCASTCISIADFHCRIAVAQYIAV